MSFVYDNIEDLRINVYESGSWENRVNNIVIRWDDMSYINEPLQDYTELKLPDSIGYLYNLKKLTIYGKYNFKLIFNFESINKNIEYIELHYVYLINSPLVKLDNLTHLSIFNINKNYKFTLTSLVDLLSNKLTYFSANLSGIIPSNIDKLSNLNVLYLENDKIIGNIPKSLGNLTKLEQLGLRSNKLTGNIPISLSNLTKLEHLTIYAERLNGPIPIEICQIKSLRKLIISPNLWSPNIEEESNLIQDPSEYESGIEFYIE